MSEEAAKPPKVFISYAWEDDVKLWVRRFAKRLREDGVDARLDEWETDYGDPLPEFMERAVRESNFVIILCTPKYKKKSDEREGGVGYEGNIITAEIFQKNNYRKFIPVLRKGNLSSALPSWAAGRFSMDLSGEPYSDKNYRRLLRTLHGRKYTPPPVGRPPDFPDEEDDSLGEPKPRVPRKPMIHKDTVEGFLVLSKAFMKKSSPLFRFAGILIIIGLLLWGGLLAIPKRNLLIPTANSTVTEHPTARIASTNSFVTSIKTLETSTTPKFSTITFTSTATSTPTFTPTTTFTPTNTFTSTPFVILNNNIPMILIPRGAFNKYDKENGYIRVSLPDYYIDQHEVTNSEYQKCVDAGICGRPFPAGSNYKNVEHFGDNAYKDYPIVLISFNRAKAYCEWRGSGIRMPTGEEWEKAARGKLVEQTYPWGNNPPSCELGTLNGTNYFGCNARDAFPVMSFAQNGYGLFDMSGNVAEWVDEANKLIRGGSWLDNESRIKVFSTVEGKTFDGYVDVGFRCARDVP